MLQTGFVEKFKKQIRDAISVVKDNVENEINLNYFMDTLQAIRDDIKGEYDAIRLYEDHVRMYTQLLQETRNSVYEDLIKITNDIIKEEEAHVGELNELLNKVDPEQMQKFEEGVREAQEKLNGNVQNEQESQPQDSSDILDEQLGGGVYKKLRELGYTPEQWRNFTKEKAQRIIHGNEQPTQQKSKSESSTSSNSVKAGENEQTTKRSGVSSAGSSNEGEGPGEIKSKKEEKLAIPEGAELRQKIFNDVDGKMTIEEIENSEIMRKMGRDSALAQKRIAQKHNIPIDEKTGTYNTSDISNSERWEMRKNIAKEMLSRGSVGVDENGKTKKDEDGNVIYDGPVKKEYRAEIVLGAPAGGKSSVIVDKVSKNTGSMVLDADENKRLIPEFEGGVGAGLVHKESADIILEQMIVPEFGKGGRMEGTNLVIPIVGKNPKAALRYLKLLKEAGYNVNLSFNEVSTLNSVKRATTRAIETGRYLSPEYLKGIGNKPSQTYEYFKSYDDNGVHFDTFTKYNNDVRQGQPANLLEHKSFGGEDIEKEEWR